MKRGDIFSAATRVGFGTKPRPVVIVQSNLYLDGGTVLAALLTDQAYGIAPIRPIIEPDSINCLKKASAVMTDILAPVRQDEFGYRIGQLSLPDLQRMDQALLLTLGFAQ